METKEIASKLVEYCRNGEWDRARSELYSKDTKSVEPFETSGYPREVKGMDAINAKTKKFDSSLEKLYGVEVSEPLIAGNSIAFTLTMDMTIKGKGRTKSPELCVYEVKDGKIVSEQFYV